LICVNAGSAALASNEALTICSPFEAFIASNQKQRTTQMTGKILCATDGELHSDIPVTFAARLSTALGAKLSLIAVNILVTDVRSGSYRLWADEKEKEVADHAVETAKKAGAPSVEIVKAVGRDPAAVIVDYAEKNGFDHIVVGSPRTGVARLVLGSVAAEVAAKAHCPVTVAR
jgi:nucleotide-binding universal stress UspA family protein